MAFIVADQFPGVFAQYPRIQEANRSLRAWLGMESPRASRLSEDRWKETEKILGRHSPTKTQVEEQDLAEYHE